MKKLKVKALKYTIEVTDGFLEYTHGFKYPIEEIYIPSTKVCFNNKGYAFISDKARNENKETSSNSKKIEIDKDISVKLLKFIKLQKEIENSFVPMMFPKNSLTQ